MGHHDALGSNSTRCLAVLLGSIVGTFAREFLKLGSFTTTLFQASALPLIVLLIFATGMLITLKTSGPVRATTGVVLLLCKSVIPAAAGAGRVSKRAGAGTAPSS